MLRKQRSSRLTRAAVLLSVSMLAGCHLVRTTQTDAMDAVQSHTFNHSNWSEKHRHMKNQVEEVTLVHTIDFAPGDSDLSEVELSELLMFLQESGVHDGARIEIDGPRDQGGYHDPLTAARMSAIEAELTGIGLRSQVPARPITSLVKPEEAIAVTVSRAMVILPDCDSDELEIDMRPRSVFTCATTAALGMMIADPLDLKRGQVLGPSDGAAATGSIQRYRAGKTKALKIESSR